MLRFQRVRRFLFAGPPDAARSVVTCALVGLALLAFPWSGRSASAPPAATTLTMKFSPPSGTHFITASPPIQVSGCETFYQIEDAIITVNGSGATYTEQAPGSGNCNTSYSRRFDVTGPPLVPGENTVTANVFNANGDGMLGSATYFYDAYAIAVSGGFDPTVSPGVSGNVQFTVNNTGGLGADAKLTVVCSLTCALVGSSLRHIDSLQSASVSVQFTAGAADGAYVIRLAAEYSESPTTADTAEVTVHVRSPVDHVSIAPSSPIQVGMNQGVLLTATVYDAQNVPLAGRSIAWSVGNSAIASVSSSSTSSTTLTGHAVGTTTVSASSEGQSASANVTVTPSPGPTVSFLPPSNTHFTSSTQAITVRGCHPTLPVTDVAFTWGESLTWTETDASAACGGVFGREFHTTLTLPAHQNVLSVLVSVDNGTASTPASATYFLDQYAIAVAPHGGSGPSLLPGDTDTLSFVVRNTGNLVGTIAVAATCPAGFSCSVLGLPTFVLSPSDSLSVDVAFTAGGSAGARTLGLTATYQSPGSGSDQGTYTVTVGTPPPVVANVNVVLSGATIAPGAHTTATATLFDAVGAPVPGQGVTWSSSASSVATVTSTGALTGDVAGIATGTAWIRAVAANGVTDSAQISVQTTVTPAVMAASATDLNPGTAFDRSLCLTVSLGSAAAAQCGDVRVVHALPAVLERGVRQQPVLLYTTATAHPIQLVAVNVQYTSGSKPDSVQAILRVNGVERRRGMWPGFALQPTVARRLVLGYDVATLATGIQPWTVEVAGYNANTRGTPVTVSGQFVVVNRAQSRFGAGWWLAGLEQLFPQADGSLLWVGGDGSARRYASAGTNVWVPPPLTFPDTITRTGTVYTRHAPGAVQVRFNSAGNHVATVRPVGDSTTFVYGTTGATPQLNTIRTLTGSVYTFGYVSGRLRTVAAPYVDGGVRTTTLQAGSSGQITSITDPDTSVVSFSGLPFFPRVVASRTDRRGTTTTFTYPVALRVHQATVAMDSVPDLVTRLESVELKGIFADGVGVLVDTALAYTMIDGPRGDVGDSTRVWTDLRFGAPRRILDAVGITTRLARTNATYPALVTRVERGGLQVQRLVYDARAHVHLAIDSGGIVAGRPDTTRYEWNNTFDAVEQVVPPEGDNTLLTYDATTGNLLTREDARGASSRVSFQYYGGTGADRQLLQAIQYPSGPAGTPVESFIYDTNGNVRETRTPLGFVTTIARDAVGRDTLVITPIDSLGHTLLQRQTFDIVDQVRRVATIGSSAIPYTLGVAGVSPDTAAVRNDTLVRMFDYDREGNRTSVNSYTADAPTDVGTVQSFTYDNANRLLTTDAGSGPWVHRYDAAGNDTAQTYGTGLTVRQAFDAGNRLTRRIVPQRTFPRRRCQGFPAGPISEPAGGLGCQLQFPYYANDGADGYVIAADTSVFAYDALGRLQVANNRYARITRAYTPSGLLLTDSVAMGLYSVPSVDDVPHVQRYTYDRNGRRSTMAWPEGTTGYGYTNFGALGQVTDPDDNTYTLAYDAQGRVDSLAIAPAGGGERAGVGDARV